MRRVQFVELGVSPHRVPLVSGYLQAYATLDSHIRTTHTFATLATPVTTPREQLLRHLLSGPVDVFAFSCYVWNIRAVTGLVGDLVKAQPKAHFLLGGPQVDGHASDYLDLRKENVVVCNGEGEVVFANFLAATAAGADLLDVPGLSVVRDRQILHTTKQVPIADVNEIPSPFLSGIFDDDLYVGTEFETTRGCPYNCSFCYWGKGEAPSLRKFSVERVTEELSWIARKHIMYLHMADANWGILSRDLELSEHIVRLKKRYGAPRILTFASAKAQPERTTQIAATFHDARIITSHRVGLQSLTPKVLKNIDRRNIDPGKMLESRRQLEAKGVTTYVELIWPLPGETLQSFCDNLSALCGAIRVSAVIVYPLAILKSTPLENRVGEFGLQSEIVEDPHAEYDLVYATKDAPRGDVERGMWTIYGLYSLFNCGTLRNLGGELHRRRLVSWGDLCRAFGDHCRKSRSPASSFWHDVAASRDWGRNTAFGGLAHSILHERRDAFLAELAGFLRQQEWWGDIALEVLFELDRLSTPYLYSNTELNWAINGHSQLRHFRVSRSGAKRLRITPRPGLSRLSQGIAQLATSGATEVDYERDQLPYMPSKSLEENLTYAYGMLQRTTHWAPVWTLAPIARPEPFIPDT